MNTLPPIPHALPGSRDQQFGKNSIADIGSAWQTATNSSGVAHTERGELLAAWSFSQPDETTLGLARFTPDGIKDWQYGREGLAVGSFIQDYRASVLGVALQGDGRALVYGNALIPYHTGYRPVPSLLCFTPDGKVDTSFGTKGVFSLPNLAEEQTYGVLCSVCTLPDDGILIVYSILTDKKAVTQVVKLTAKGAVDQAFGSEGVIDFTVNESSTQAGGIKLLSNGRFAVFSSFTSEFSFIACFNNHGERVRDFGENGVVTLSYPGMLYTQLNLIETHDGLITVGTASLGGDFYRGMMAGLTTVGAVNPQFNHGRPVLIAHPTVNDGAATCHQISVQPDNKLVISGYRPLSATAPEGFIGRFEADGRPDNSFGKEGLVGSGPFVLTSAQQGLTLLPEESRTVLAGVNDGRGALVAYRL